MTTTTRWTTNPPRGKKGKRSGISRTVEDMVVYEIDWPHFYVYRGQERKPIQYAQITQSEFMYGFLAMLDNPRNTMDKEVMLALLKDLMLDASQYGWTHIRSYYSMLASGVEMARYSWSDTAQIAELRMQFAQRPMFGSQQRQPYNSRQSIPQGNVRICIPFQSDTCPHFGAHDGYNHACAFCFANTGMLFNHKERDCRRKVFKSKNGLQGGDLNLLPLQLNDRKDMENVADESSGKDNADCGSQLDDVDDSKDSSAFSVIENLNGGTGKPSLSVSESFNSCDSEDCLNLTFSVSENFNSGDACDGVDIDDIAESHGDIGIYIGVSEIIDYPFMQTLVDDDDREALVLNDALSENNSVIGEMKMRVDNGHENKTMMRLKSKSISSECNELIDTSQFNANMLNIYGRVVKTGAFRLPVFRYLVV